MNNQISYLKDSNFYALQVAASEQFPEITSQWISAQFTETMLAEVAKKTGRGSQTIRELRTTIKSYLKEEPSCDESLEKMAINYDKGSW